MTSPSSQGIGGPSEAHGTSAVFPSHTPPYSEVFPSFFLFRAHTRFLNVVSSLLSLACDVATFCFSPLYPESATTSFPSGIAFLRLLSGSSGLRKIVMSCTLASKGPLIHTNLLSYTQSPISYKSPYRENLVVARASQSYSGTPARSSGELPELPVSTCRHLRSYHINVPIIRMYVHTVIARGRGFCVVFSI